MNATMVASEARSLPPPWLPVTARPSPAAVQVRPAERAGAGASAPPWRETLSLLEQHLPIKRRLVHSGDPVHRVGEPCVALHVVNAGMVRVVKSSPDGRAQAVGLLFKGDWLGFDGIASGRFGCDAIALDVGEIWTFRYDLLLLKCTTVPALMALMHAAMSRQIGRDSDLLLAMGTLPADARVADFLKFWAERLGELDLRSDRILLHMTRAEIGNKLGMSLETVSRALNRMARVGVVYFNGIGRREIGIPSLAALGEFFDREAASGACAVSRARAAAVQLGATAA
jgi:CRP/FNR family transcriptional regulator, anaerobic regulatory protein